jgi:FkbM family methyltransferase
MADSELRLFLHETRLKMESGAVKVDYEMMLEKHFRRWLRPGDTVLDVGAHTGRHLGVFLDCVGSKGQVLAFEPLPFAFKILKSKFSGTRAVLNNVALAKEAGRAQFTFAQGTPEESGLKQRIFNVPGQANPKVIEVQVDTMDAHCQKLSSLSFVKIDTEGGEIGCLQGGEKTLARLRPLVSVEYGYPSYSVYGYTKDTLYDFATQAGYQLVDIFLNHLAEREDWKLCCDGICWDFFMVPNERIAEFTQRLGPRAII